MKRFFLLGFLILFFFNLNAHAIFEHKEKLCLNLNNEKHFHKDPFSKFCNFCLNFNFFIIFLNSFFLFILLFLEKNLKSVFFKQNFIIYLKVRAPPQKF